MTVLLVLEGTPTDACLKHERNALLQLKPFFNHHNKLADWDEVKSSDCCEWMGIECNTTTRRLIGLSLNYTRNSDETWYLNVSLLLPFVELKSLYLPENAIAGCIENEGFEKLSSNLTGNQMKGSSHPKGFQWLSRLKLNNLTKLKYLDLSGNRIESISNQDGTHLELLNLEELDLSDIKGLNYLTKLKRLDLSWNGIESISNRDEMHQKLPELKQLDLSNNLFRNNTILFPKGLSSLKSLSMYGNDLQGSIDIKGLENLTNLKELDLRWNGIESLESYKDDATQRQQMIHLEELRLDGNLLNNSISFLCWLTRFLPHFSSSLQQSGNSISGSEENNRMPVSTSSRAT
ncbi:hypothetical protein V6N13_047382 [Hibiscus sabdariffa]